LVFQGNGGSDLVSLEGSNAAAKYGFDLRFVCQTSTRGYFNNVINGVLGVSPSPSSFLSQMHASGKLEHPRFSLCFNDVDKGSNDESGLVTFGGFIQSPNTVMVYAKKLNGPAYRVNIKNIHIREGGGKFTRVDKHQRIVIAQLPDGVDTSAKVDSAEPFLTFDKRLEPAFRAAWKEITGEEYSQARQSLTKEEIKMMPTLLIELEVSRQNYYSYLVCPSLSFLFSSLLFVTKGDPDSLHELDPTTVPSLTSNYNVLVAVPAIRYMELTTAEVRPYRPRIQFEGEKGSFLGTNMMQGHTISFEPDVNRIGFAESLDCEPGKGGRSIDDDQVVQVGAMHENLPASTGEASTKMSSAAAAVSPGVLDIGEDEEYAAGDASNKGKTTEENFGGGGCFTATCRSFMALGYIFIGTALAVAYRASRAKERTADDFESSLFEDGPIRKNDDLYRRKGSWNEPPPTSAFV
jgi:hypothetical protein